MKTIINSIENRCQLLWSRNGVRAGPAADADQRPERLTSRPGPAGQRDVNQPWLGSSE
jgi:hypothetical protein